MYSTLMMSISLLVCCSDILENTPKNNRIGIMDVCKLKTYLLFSLYVKMSLLRISSIVVPGDVQDLQDGHHFSFCLYLNITATFPYHLSREYATMSHGFTKLTYTQVSLIGIQLLHYKLRSIKYLGGYLQERAHQCEIIY